MIAAGLAIAVLFVSRLLIRARREARRRAATEMLRHLKENYDSVTSAYNH